MQKTIPIMFQDILLFDNTLDQIMQKTISIMFHDILLFDNTLDQIVQWHINNTSVTA